MTHNERIQALQSRGYDATEARFLVKAALHGGYFLRRQFLAFSNETKGWKDELFFQKLEGNRHCRIHVYRHDRWVIHLSAKPLYEAIGEPDNRNRREHQPSTIKNKVMVLDLVLDHPDHRFLATEREKIEYFVSQRGVATEHLPTRYYASPTGRGASAKHFVDAGPIFLAAPGEGGISNSGPTFCYIDEGLQTTDRFASYLNQYLRLFRAIGDFQVVYVADSRRLLASAERVFHRFQEAVAQPAARLSAPERQMLTYFERRRDYENGDFTGFDTAKLIELREARKHYATAEYEALYERWRVRAAVQSTSRGSAIRGVEARFSTLVLELDYDLFGRLTAPDFKRRNAETPTEIL